MRVVPVLLLVAALASATFPSGPGEAKAWTWPCYWVHGRMRVGNGTPSTRIWPVGTHRLLGVVNPGSPEEDVGMPDTLPMSLRRLSANEKLPTVWGDFYVCPVAPERAGWMRFVIVKRARRLRAEPD